MPGQPHPVYSDSDDVLWLALEQLLFTDPLDTEDLPLVWFGYNVQGRFLGRREAQGFLMTDHRLIVKDQVDRIFGQATPCT